MEKQINSRKFDHIELTKSAQIKSDVKDERFFYEPMFSAHPNEQSSINTNFLGFNLHAPLWISSMTGGTGKASHINKNLALACEEFGLGMGLGSIRPLLESDEYFNDFNLRQYLSPERPLFANIGICQLEELVRNRETAKLDDLVYRLEANGLIIHVNPMQEWYQDEGDQIKVPPIETITAYLETKKFPVIVKEVGQGMGPESLRALMNLSIEAIEFGSFGGTNFSKLEQLRSSNHDRPSDLIGVGHDATEMVGFVNDIVASSNEKFSTEFIISGGIKSFLDGLSLIDNCRLPAVYAQASEFLSHASGDYEVLRKFLKGQVEGIKMAKAYLAPKTLETSEKNI